MELKTLPALALLIILTSFSLAGCTSLFFHPTPTRYPFLEEDLLAAESVTLISKDGTKLSAWRIGSAAKLKKPPRGITLQFHGNAENMTSHYRFQEWLLDEGWDVLTFDYRGYGSSEGSTSNLQGLAEDGVAAINWANKLATEKSLPLVIFGQSLGASISISALQDINPERLRLLIIDSGFYSFTSITQEKLGDVWFLWPFQWLSWILVSDELSAGPKLKTTGAHGAFATPALFLHSVNDPVVSNRQGEKLYEIYPGPKERWTTNEPGHVNTLFGEVTDETPPKAIHREKLKVKLQEILEM